MDAKLKIKSMHAKQYPYGNETLKGSNVLATVIVTNEDGTKEEKFVVLTAKELARAIYQKTEYLLNL